MSVSQLVGVKLVCQLIYIHCDPYKINASFKFSSSLFVGVCFTRTTVAPNESGQLLYCLFWFHCLPFIFYPPFYVVTRVFVCVYHPSLGRSSDISSHWSPAIAPSWSRCNVPPTSTFPPSLSLRGGAIIGTVRTLSFSAHSNRASRCNREFTSDWGANR